jgi:Flp pilus assembly protein TadG
VSRFAELDPAPRHRRPLVVRWLGLVRDTRGISSIEIALVIGLLFMIVLASLDFGRALAAKNEMSHALGRATRVVNLNPSTTPEEVVALLEEDLADYGTTDLDVEITELSGTSYMRISVSFPFQTALPYTWSTDILLTVSTLAPMVSPTL